MLMFWGGFFSGVFATIVVLWFLIKFMDASKAVAREEDKRSYKRRGRHEYQ